MTSSIAAMLSCRFCEFGAATNKNSAVWVQVPVQDHTTDSR